MIHGRRQASLSDDSSAALIAKTEACKGRGLASHGERH